MLVYWLRLLLKINLIKYLEVTKKVEIRAATYTRFSSDNQKEKSIEDQLRNCHEKAEAEGWSVVKDYNDMAMSGKLKDRPGFQQLMQDAKVGRFEILIIDDLSRLTRGIDAATLVEQLKYQGVRLVTVSDGIDSNNKSAKLEVGLKGMMNNIFLDDMKEKVHRGQMGNALSGKNTGGKSYGYKLVPVFSDTETDVYGRPAIAYSDMEVDPEQAKTINQIFDWVIDQRPYKWIANELNRLNVPTVHKGNWTTSTICGNSKDPHSGILNNPIYIGKKYWNRTEQIHDPDTGKSKSRFRDESEWVISERPDLRIISEEKWIKVKKEQERRKQKTAQKTKETGRKSSRTGAGPKFLLSGLLKCSECGGNYITVGAGVYGCGNSHRAGESVCGNKEKIKRSEIETAITDILKKGLFNPDVVQVFREEVARLVKEKKADFLPNKRKLESELQSLERKIEKLIDFIMESESPPSSIANQITKLEQRQKQINVEIQQQRDSIADIDPLVPRALEKYHELVDDLPNAVKGYIPPVRDKISKLFGGEIIVGPKPDGSLEGSVRGSFSGLLGLNQDVKINDGTLRSAFLLVWFSHLFHQYVLSIKPEYKPL